MNSADDLKTIVGVELAGPMSLAVSWSSGLVAELDMAATATRSPFRSLSDPAVFAAVEVGEWGHSLVWPGDVELGADALWLDTMAVTGRDDVQTFLSWRLRHGLSVAGAAAALDLSEHAVARYSNGQGQVPRTVLLACRGWEALQAA